MANNSLKKVLDIIGMIIIILSIIVFSLIIGANEKPLPTATISALFGLSIIIIILRKVLLKEKIVLKSNIDICVLLFMVSLTLPLLLRTYCTYQGTIEFIIKYFYVYSIYILCRKTIDTQKRVNAIIVTTIISSLIIIILGLDIFYGNKLKIIIEVLDLKYIKSENFSSTFGYANATAIYLLFCIFLSINRIENSNSKLIKILYISYILLSSYIIYITQSRVVLILLFSSIFIYSIAKNYKGIMRKKKLFLAIIVVLCLLTLGFITYIAIAGKYSKPVPLETLKKIKKQFNPNEKYVIQLDLNIDCPIETDNNNVELQIIQINQYFQERVLTIQHLDLRNTQQTIEFTPTDSVYYIKLVVNNLDQPGIMINKCYINGEEYIFRSKYIPYVLFKATQTLSLKDESLLQRKHFLEASIEMAKEHLIIGNGGNAWKKLYFVYQKYPYYIKESHSYFTELLISYGIIGVITFLSIIILLYISTIRELFSDKEKQKNKLSLMVALGLLLLQSITFDFNMSFILIILIVFIFIAILQFSNNQNKNKEINNSIHHILDYTIITSFILVFIVLTRANISNGIKDPKKKKEICSYIADYQYQKIANDYRNNCIQLDDLKEFIKKEPYTRQNYIYNQYIQTLKKSINSMSTEELNSNLMFIINTFKKYKCGKMMNYKVTLERAKIMIDFVSDLENSGNDIQKKWALELRKIIEDEYKINIINMSDCERNQMTEELSNETIETYKSFLNEIGIYH